MAGPCTYHFTDENGNEVSLKGLAAFQAYLAEGGLEHLFPKRKFPWSAGAFSPETNDIRYSRPSNFENDLIVTHNLSEANLLHAQKMGGIPVPSLAVTNKATPLTGFGEITLIGSKELADPKGYAKTQVFGADIYSPRYPRVEYQVSSKEKAKAEKYLQDAEEATGKYFDWDELRNNGAKYLSNSFPLMWKFLTEKGINPVIVKEELAPLAEELQPFENFNFKHELYKNDAFIKAAEAYQRRVLGEIYQGDTELVDEEINADLAKAAERDEEPRFARIAASKITDYSYTKSRLKASGGVNTAATATAMDKQIRDAGLSKELDAFVDDFVVSLNADEKIFKGYTNAGSRSYTPHTLENVVKILKKELRGGEGFNYGVGSIRSQYTPKFKSIEEIRKSKDRLIGNKEFEQIKAEIDSEFSELVSELAPYHSNSKNFGFGDTVSSAAYDAAKMGVPRALKENGFEEVPGDVQKQMAVFLGKLRDLPTEYFEAKILREVDIAEFSGAVVPDDISEKAMKALRDRGVTDIRTYKRGDEDDRAKKISSFEHLLFSRKKYAEPKPTLRISEADAKQYLLDNFGVGINNLIDNGVLRFTNGKEAWPEAARRAARGDEEAVYINGKAYIDLTATGRDRLNAVVLHELGEHYSLRRMLGDNAYRSLQQQVTNRAKIAGSRAEKVWNTVKRNYDHLEEGSEAFVSEVIAKLGELDPKAPWYRRLISQIKAFLMQHGLARGVVAGTITEADLHTLLRASLNSAARGFEKDEPRLFGLGMAYSVADRNERPDMLGFLEEFAKDDEIFGYPVSDKKDLAGVMREVAPMFKYRPELNAYVTEAKEAPTKVFKTESGKPAYVVEGGGKVWIDVSSLRPGDRGGAFYAAVGNYAYNNGLEFIDDPAGVSREAVLRRPQHMLSLALKFGTTDFLGVSRNFEEQSEKHGLPLLNWGTDSDRNLVHLIIRNVTPIYQALPGLRDIKYDFETKRFRRITDGRALQDVWAKRISVDEAARRNNIGEATIRRAVFLQSLASSSREEKSRLLEELGATGRLAGGVPLKAAFSRPEELPEKIVIDGKERWTVNSDGKQIHPTEQGVRNFWKWFNDSAVVDEKGRPQVMYHGTTRDFSSFDVGESGQKDSGWYGTGFYFTPDTLTASAYADYDQEATGQNVIPVYLKIENPFEWESDVVPMKTKEQSDGFRRLMLKMGVDGVFAENKYADPKFAKRYEVVAFNPEQIKSATGNIGDFSGENNDIRFSRLGDKIEQLNRTPEGDNTWLGDVIDTLDKAADTVFRKRLAFLSVKQIIEVAKHYMPGLNEYEGLMQSREALISGWLRKADRLVSETWRKLPKPIQRQLAGVMHESTLEDVHAGLDWLGVREVFDKEGPQGFEAYTQYNLAPSYKAELLRKAEEAGATILDGKAIFRSESQARNFLPEIEQSEATLKKFRQKNFPEIFAKEEARENEYRRLAKLYKALPEQAQKVYTEATVMHDDLFKDRLEELQNRIVSAVENGQKQKALLAQIREKFESQSINWYYAPLARYGSYWFYGEDASGERWFRTFETKRQWERGKKEFQGKLLGEGRNLDNLELLEGEQVSDSFIKSVQSQITETVADKDTRDLLQDQIYQMFLQTLPDISVRHSSMHRKGTKGYTEDAMRAYSSAMHHGATQLGNMKYGRDMRQVLTNHNEAKAVASGKERRDAYQAIIDAAEMLQRDWKGKVEKGVLESELAEAKEAEDEDQVRVLNEAIKIRDRLGADHPSPNGPLDYIIEEKQKILGIASSIPMSKLTKASDVLDELVLAYDHMVKYNSTDMDRVASMLNQMNFVNMLGFGLSSGIVNMIQTPGVAMPVAVGRHGSKTVPAFNKAFMQFMKAVASGKRDVDGNASITEELRTELEAAKSANNSAKIDELEDEIRMLEGFKDDGTISRTQTFDIIGVGREGASYGGRMQEFSKWAGWMFHHGERLNREVTLTAAYRLEKARLMGEGKSAKMAHLDAIEYARYVNNRAHLDYSSENAARIFRGPLARIALQFKKYQQGMLFLWGKSLADAIGKIDEAEFEHGADGKLTTNGRGLFEAAKRNRQEARRTFIALVFMQGSLAGALSMPTMGAISALYGMLGAMIGDDDEPWDLEKDLRLGLAKYLGDVPAEVAAKGFVNAFTSVNLASRLDQADIFFKEPLKEMEGRDAATAYLAEVLGPTGGTVAKVWQGMSYLADGYWMRGAESMTPKFVGDIVKAARFAEEGAKTLDNMPLKDMSAMESFMQGLGFGSSALERRYAERGFAKEREAAIKDTRTKIMREAAWAKIKGEPVDMAAIRAWNLKHPEKKILAENISASMKGIKQSVKIREEKGYSVDPKLEYLYEENEVME